jgi:BASS family bile acid:Na+ symporter
MITLLRFIASAMAPLTLAAAIVGFIWPQTFTLFGSIFKELFAATMFALGIVLNPDDLASTLKQPQRIGLGVLTQYLVMPLLAFTIATLAGLPPALALGFIIVGSAPGAMASNVIVYLAGGVLAFSIALTTVATFLSPLLTPLLVKYLGGQFMDISFWKLMWTIVYILVVPLAGGMLLRHYLSQPCKATFVTGHVLLAVLLISLMYSQSGFASWQIILCALFVMVLPFMGLLLGQGLSTITLRWAREIAPAIASLAIIVICAYAVAKNQQQIANVGLIVFVLVVLLNALGYLAGWHLARLYRFDQAHQLTLSIEIGMQNAGMGVALALAHFGDQPEVALPGALFAVWCIITAAGASSWLRKKHALVTG